MIEGDRVALEDLESKNGTRVGGTPVSQVVYLTRGDVVVFGGIETRLEVLHFDDAATNPL